MYCQLSCQPFYLLISFETIEAGEDSFVILVLKGLETQWSHNCAVRQGPICKIDDDCLSIPRERALSNLKLSSLLIKNIIFIFKLRESCKAASSGQREKKPTTTTKHHKKNNHPKTQGDLDVCLFVCFWGMQDWLLFFFFFQNKSCQGKENTSFMISLQDFSVFNEQRCNRLHCLLVLIISLRWSSPSQAWELVWGLKGFVLLLGIF